MFFNYPLAFSSKLRYYKRCYFNRFFTKDKRFYMKKIVYSFLFFVFTFISTAMPVTEVFNAQEMGIPDSVVAIDQSETFDMARRCRLVNYTISIVTDKFVVWFAEKYNARNVILIETEIEYTQKLKTDLTLNIFIPLRLTISYDR